MYPLTVEDLSTEDHDGGVPGLIETISRRVPLCWVCVPNPIHLLSCEGEGQPAGEAVAEVIDIQLYSGHGRLR